MSLEILNPKQKQLFLDLAFTKDLELYLAGGTALALYYRHRTSVDFDFYRGKEFKAGELRSSFEQNLSKHTITMIRDNDNTFEIKIQKINLSCFYYPYPLIKPFTVIEGIRLASLEDIAAMKMIAITQRGSYRDFIDIYYLLQTYPLPKLFQLTREKYQTFDVYSGLRGLIYFEDAEVDTKKKRIQIFDSKLTWRKVKNFIREQVVSYQKSFIRK